jgi:hypothetical protein
MEDNKRGGKREGAGRKKGSLNLIKQELRENIDAESLIKIQEEAAKTGRVPYKDKDGNERSREIRPKDQLDAGQSLLRKVLPDLRSDDITIHDNKLNINLTIGHGGFLMPPDTPVLKKENGISLKWDLDKKAYVPVKEVLTDGAKLEEYNA